MKKRIRLHSDEVLFVILFGIVATIISYQFGLGNQTEHLPIVLRLLDPGYLQNDFFVNSAVEFGPRFYYVHLIAFLAQWIPLPLVLLALALVINIALAALSILAVRDLLGGDRMAAFVAAILVVSVSSVPLGLVTDIRFLDLQPASLAIPGCLASLWAGLRAKPIVAACLAGISCLPHPLYGVETGAIAIGTALFVGLVDPVFPPSKTRLVAVFVRVSAATLLLTSFAVIFWALPQIGNHSEPITTREIIDILAYFRAPHHYVPSLFPIEHYAALILFIAAFAMCWSRWSTHGHVPSATLNVLAPVIAVLLACLAGYLLIEVWPTRIGVIAQPFRMLYIVKWLGLLFLGWQVAEWIGKRNLRASFGWISLLGSGAAHAVIAFLSLAAERVDQRLRRFTPRVPQILAPIVLLLCTVFLLIRAGKIEETLLVGLGLCIAIPLSKVSQRFRARAFSVGLVVFVVLVAGLNRSFQVFQWKVINPIVTFADHRGDHADVASWALNSSSPRAVFLIPPDMGTFRLLARRSVVVDFEAIPFEGAAMREWRRRIQDCYGDVATGGFKAREDLVQNYQQIDSGRIESLLQSYDINFAVLYTQTQTHRPVLYQNSTFKIVALTRE